MPEWVDPRDARPPPLRPAAPPSGDPAPATSADASAAPLTGPPAGASPPAPLPEPTAGLAPAVPPNGPRKRIAPDWPARRERAVQWTKASWPILVVIVAASVLYAQGLDRAEGMYFDETYYVYFAHQIAHGDWEDPCWAHDKLGERPVNWEHPPLVKLVLAGTVAAWDIDKIPEGCRDPNGSGVPAGSPPVCYVALDGTNHTTGKTCFDAYAADMKAHGNPWAWRLPGAIAGVLAVAGAALATRRLLGSPWTGALAGILLMSDGLAYTSARIALLDVYATGFTMLAVWAATFASARGRLGAGLFLGLAFCSKYTALFAGLPVLLVGLWSHHRAGALTRRTFDRTLASTMLIPALTWVVSYLPWWVTWTQRHGFVWAVKHWVMVQAAAMRWMSGWGEPPPTGEPHPYASVPAQWFGMADPVYYYLGSDPRARDGYNEFIYGMPNPILWWAAAAAMIGVLAWLASHAWHALVAAMDSRGRAPPAQESQVAAAPDAGHGVPPSVSAPPTSLSGQGAPGGQGPPSGPEVPSIPAGPAAHGAQAAPPPPDPWPPVREGQGAPPPAASGAGLATSAALASNLSPVPADGPAPADSGQAPASPALAVPLPKWRLDSPFATPARQALAVTAVMAILVYLPFLALTRTSFLFYMTIGVPFLSLALAAYVHVNRDDPSAFGWLGGVLAMVLFIPWLLSPSRTGLAACTWADLAKWALSGFRDALPGDFQAPYFIALAWSAWVALLGFGGGFTRHPRLWARICMTLLVGLCIVAFVHYFPILDGVAVHGDRKHDIIKAIPWTGE